jgi:hypothetical protein
VFSNACDSASITSVMSKWRPFSFIFSQGNRKVGQVGDDSHVVLGQKFHGEKGSVRQCAMMQQPVLLLPKFRAKSFPIFMQSQYCADLTVLPSRTNSLQAIPLMSKKTMSMSLSRLLQSAMNRAYHLSTCLRLMLSSLNTCLIIARVSFQFFLRLAQNLILFLCRIRLKIASGQIHNSK